MVGTFSLVFQHSTMAGYGRGRRRSRGGRGGVITPAAPKKQMRRKQMNSAKTAPSAQSLAQQRSESAIVLNLLIDISSHLQVTEEYIAQCKETEVSQTQVR